MSSAKCLSQDTWEVPTKALDSIMKRSELCDSISIDYKKNIDKLFSIATKNDSLLTENKKMFSEINSLHIENKELEKEKPKDKKNTLVNVLIGVILGFLVSSSI